MDFGALPPEFNSVRMYTGAGSAPILAAASAWRQLAAELGSMSAAYQSVVSGLVSQGWLGPSSMAMAVAVSPYVTWMANTAAQAEQTANQANAAAAAYESAFAMTVPPAAVAANRVQTAALAATNVLGQNSAAIAALEALYAAMWAQDAGAMYGYAGNSAAATKLAPLASPPSTTNAEGLAASAASNTQTALSQFTSNVPPTLQALAAPVQPPIDYNPTVTGGDLANAMTNLASSSFSPMGLAGISQLGADIAVIRGAALAAADPLSLGGLGIGHLTPGLVPGVGMSAIAPAGSGAAGAVAAGIGRATPVGALMVPQTWAAAAPMANPAATPALVASWASAVPQAEPGGMPGMPGMPMVGSGGRGLGFAAPRYGFKLTVMPRPVIAG